jgi:hypothetical protein
VLQQALMQMQTMPTEYWMKMLLQMLLQMDKQQQQAAAAAARYA